MIIRLQARVEFQVPVRAAHVRMLMALSQAHYDGVCKSAGLEGGFLYGWKNQTNWWGEQERQGVPEEDEHNYVVTASFSDLDTCLKILEVPELLYEDEAKELVADMRDLRSSFRGALRLANTKWSEWQAVYAPQQNTSEKA